MEDRVRELEKELTKIIEDFLNSSTEEESAEDTIRNATEALYNLITDIFASLVKTEIMELDMACNLMIQAGSISVQDLRRHFNAENKKMEIVD